MTDQLDPFDLLASMAASDRDGALTDRRLEPGDDERADALLRRVTSTPLSTRAPVRLRPRRRPRRLVAAAAVVSIVGAGAAVAAVWSRQPADAVTVLCYSDAAVEPAAVVALTAAPGRTPVEQCAEPWADGRLGTGEAPELVACVSELDATAVVPGDAATCERLGWPLADPRTAAGDLDAEVFDQLSELFFDRCVGDLEVALAEIEQLFADLGADAWSVSIGDGVAITDDRPCVAISIDAAAHAVLVLAVQPPPG